MIKVTLEFENVDAAIVGLGKLVGTPTIVRQPRKGRDDKGQPRGQYKPRATDGVSASPIPLHGKTTGDSVSGVTAPGNEQVGATPAATVPQAGPAEATSEASVTTEVVKATKADAPTFQQAEAAFKTFFNAKGVQPARELFAKFGIARLPELKQEQYAEFVDACAR